MRKILKYNGKEILLKPYNTVIERDVLLYTSGTYDLSILFDIFEDNVKVKPPHLISDLSDDEKKYILLELRHLSVSEVFSFVKKCGSCKEKYEIDTSFENVLNEGNLENYKHFKLKEVFSSDVNDYVNIDIDDLDLDIYDDLVEHINKNKTSFDYKSHIKCVHCGADDIIELSFKQIVENLSEDSLSNFYQSISGMIYYGKYSKLDIDSMLPFERGIYLNLLNEEIKKNNTGGL